MKPVTQTKLLPPKGNCFAACAASVLELSLDDVPDIEFEQMDDHDAPDVKEFWRVWDEWLAARNLQHLTVTVGKGVPPPLGYIIVTGTTTRHPTRFHSVVYYNGKLCYDPFPGGGGLVKLNHIDLLLPLDPALPCPALRNPPRGGGDTL